MENSEVQLIRPPVAVRRCLGSANEGALGHVIHYCLLSHAGRKIAHAFHQAKLTLMIAAIRSSDDEYNAEAASLFRCAGGSKPLWTRGSSLRDLPAGLVDAD